MRRKTTRQEAVRVLLRDMAAVPHAAIPGAKPDALPGVDPDSVVPVAEGNRPSARGPGARKARMLLLIVQVAFMAMGVALLGQGLALQWKVEFDPKTDFREATCTVANMTHLRYTTKPPKYAKCKDVYNVRISKPELGVLPGAEEITIAEEGACNKKPERPSPFIVGESIACWGPSEGKEASRLTKFYGCANEACITMKEPVCTENGKATGRWIERVSCVTSANRYTFVWVGSVVIFLGVCTALLSFACCRTCVRHGRKEASDSTTMD